MARIEFRGKLETMEYVDGTVAWTGVRIPTLTRRHCDMNAMRQHPKYGGYANSDLFPAMLARIKNEVFGTASVLKMDAIPARVAVDTSGFLCRVTFEV